MQRLLAKFVFLEGKGQYLVLNNRRLYDNFVYFSYFYNVLLGLFTFLKRVLLSAVFGLLLIVRLDRPIYATGLESWDGGFSSYVAVLILHQLHNNPSLVTFVYSLQKKKKCYKSESQYRLLHPIEGTHRSSKLEACRLARLNCRRERS
eukprot:m.126062 g.126062  ORF g.126062 m.126062 type:complete len:148 (+) comp37889_c0_seq24:1483-1926(+)